MALVADRVKETGTVSGTGSISLSGAAGADFRTFASAFPVGSQVWYAVQTANPASWEVGIGTLTSATVLSRDMVSSSSNDGALVSFPASSPVFAFCTAPANLVNNVSHGRQLAIKAGQFIN